MVTPNYLALIAKSKAFNATYFDSNDLHKHDTTLVQMPTSGTAAYAGIGAVFLGKGADKDASNATAGVIGSSKVTADFNKKTIEARVNGFEAPLGTFYPAGDLRATGSIIGTKIKGTLTGNVSANGLVHTIDGDAHGAFFKDGAEGIILGGGGTTSLDEGYFVNITGEKVD